MSLMVDEFVFAGGTPWSGLGLTLDEAPSSVKEVVDKGNLGWTVATAKMFTEQHPDGVQNWKAVYREDNNNVLGIVNSYQPILSQNIDMFNGIEPLFQSGDISFETAASLDNGRRVFGCFKINEGYKIEDDDIDHYLVVMNEHLKVDGKITILNTPVRVICQNTLIQALSNNTAKYRIKCTEDEAINESTAKRIVAMTESAKKNLDTKAKAMLSKKVTNADVEKLLDELFPIIKADGESTHAKANERTEIARIKFIECMGAENLNNYRGTQYQVFNALTDFTQHFSRDAEFGIDLEKRMSLFPGATSDSPTALVNKYLKMVA